MKTKFNYFILLFLLSCIQLEAKDIFVSPIGGSENTGTKEDPMSFESGIKKASEFLIQNGVPKEGITINVLGGTYRFIKPIILGEEFHGTEESPIRITAYNNETVLFDGSMVIDPSEFSKVRKRDEKARLSSKAVKNIVVASIEDPILRKKFASNLMLNVTIDGKEYLPSVFPNNGYSSFVEKTVKAEVSSPAVPVGKEHHGVRAGHSPYREEGKPRGWKGSIQEPRGAFAKFDAKVDEMAGTWEQWEDELKRNNRSNQLTGFCEASWLLSSQPIYAASAKDQCVQLSRALAYGWAWRKNDKPFRVFGMMCEIDKPGEWHFDQLTNRLFLYPPTPIKDNTHLSISVASGFLSLEGSQYVEIIGLNVNNVGGGSAYHIGGSNNVLANCSVTNSTATGVEIDGMDNRVVSCDFVDLNRHVSLAGGDRAMTNFHAGNNSVENCHIYQKNFTHEKVNIAVNGVGNIFRNNLVHNSIGQAMVVNGNDHLIELNEFFNVGFEEGDGGAIYSGADLGGYGNTYRYNFFHHLMHCPGKVTRAGIHLDDGQAGGTCIGNIFYKSAAKGIFAFGGAGHVISYNVFLEGDRGAYFVHALADKMYKIEQEILKDPNHPKKGIKEDYVGRVERTLGSKAWSSSPFLERYPKFNQIMSDSTRFGRLWPIRYEVYGNFSFDNKIEKIADSRIPKEALVKSNLEEYRHITPEDFVNYEEMDFTFKDNNLPHIPFYKIGLKKDEYRSVIPDKKYYRGKVKEFFHGIKSMPGTKKQFNTAELLENTPLI